jgi:hypothetical protein
MKDGLSQEDKDLAQALKESEIEVDIDQYLPNERKAQIYVCLAHDWYQIDMDEEGSRLLLKANRVFPGYFKTLVIQHSIEDENFDLIVKNLTLELAWMLLSRLGDKIS